ncbi:branched-chain amino acid ABC transporter permease [Actinoallomurus bryophytorum]|uniref:Amino acid/amide ABC transporter membrane protein 1 (HAAT family) n=1 Tax=Actinoallomurus bryophytorum TaxID=1490222 RepID=A0A543C1J1_9ACTN|nr:branched-chain amino acid ABC transporter permease [Actinoallomurus bryophytorum]TQL90945.1 amino acid/amide ABC transporter membrane protein 1 (HAAT family) [Actinoallomurus bryophytorum]
MSTFLQTLITGLLLGGVYSLVSAGLALSFGVTNIVNFAHGDFVTIGMYLAVVLGQVGIAPLAAAPLVAGVVALLGLAIYAVAIRRVVDRPRSRGDDRHVAQLAVTFALGIMIENGLMLGFGPDQRVVGSSLDRVLRIGSISVNLAQLVAFALAVVVLAGLLIMLRRTLLGKVIAAVVDDQEVAALVGVRTRRLLPATFAAGLALTALAGSVITAYYPVSPTAGVNFMTIAFVAIVLGGMRNVLGAVVGGPVIAIAQQFTATYVSPEVQNVGVFAVFIAVLLVRPQGLFGAARPA